jgi:catechol 2,3-dioxygenase-like lactoylglutathione lyase family enzyme
MLSDKKLKAFIPTTQPEKAKQFYQIILGLKLLSEDNYAMEFDANGTSLRVTRVETLNPHPFTVLGWDVEDIDSLIVLLKEKGVKFESYAFLKQDKLDIWTSPSGAKVAWFKDPDNNLLSLTQHTK